MLLLFTRLASNTRATCIALFSILICSASGADLDHWPQWRGPFENGLARGDVPTEWSDTKNIAWKIPIPGRGHSSPVIWGDRIFLTTAIPTGKKVEASAPAEGR